MDSIVINKIALYQKWPSRVTHRFGLVDTAKPTMTISIVPATKEGLEQAIDLATRSDAKLIGLREEFYDDQELQAHVEAKIAEGKFTSLFHPVKKIPGGM